MAESKFFTQHVVIRDPEEKLLEEQLKNRALTPELLKFLKRLVKTKKWTKKITIPSAHDDVAVVLLFTSSLKQGGLEIITEIHVFFAGRIVVEEWETLPESRNPSSLPVGIFASMDIEKVRVLDKQVEVALRMQAPDGKNTRILKTYDFLTEKPTVQTRPQTAESP